VTGPKNTLAVVSPHIGGVTRETVVQIAPAAVQNVTEYLAGNAPCDVVD